MKKALEIVQFIYYAGLILVGIFAVLSFVVSPVLIQFAIWAALVTVASCILAILMLGFTKWRSRQDL